MMTRGKPSVLCHRVDGCLETPTSTEKQNMGFSQPHHKILMQAIEILFNIMETFSSKIAPQLSHSGCCLEVRELDYTADQRKSQSI